MLIRTESQLVDALNKMQTEAETLGKTIGEIVAYLKEIEASDDADEYETHAAYVADAAADALEFVQWIENREK